MNLKEYAYENSLTLAEASKDLGLESIHWNTTVPTETKSKQDDGLNFAKLESIAEKLKEAPILIETQSKQAPSLTPILKVPEVPMEVKIRSCRGLGTKSPYWKELNTNA